VRDIHEEAQRAAHHGPMPALPPDPHRLPPPGDWFASDAAHHLLDKPKFCPMCSSTLERGLISEWWSGTDRVFLTWCAECRWTGNVVLFERAVIEEPEH
jgi:hypothetical protein